MGPYNTTNGKQFTLKIRIKLFNHYFSYRHWAVVFKVENRSDDFVDGHPFPGIEADVGAIPDGVAVLHGVEELEIGHREADEGAP